ncbi:MAG: MFS transporter [Brevundimonas sp.]|nr:MAG: MFS transporter [Brevundimonas sp.]
MANASAGLFGIQIVWGLQSVTTSRIFQSLGADMADLPFLWIAAPVTGLLIHPLIGWLSDRTRSPYGRRRPYIAVGAVLTAGAMIFMGSANTLGAAVLALWLLTLSVNVAMQPMRALIADIVPQDQLPRAYAVQVVFIGAGAIFASCLPWVLAQLPAIELQTSGVRSSWRLAYFVGAAALLATMGWTLATTREPPRTDSAATPTAPITAHPLRPVFWLAIGLAIVGGAAALGIRREVYLLAGVFLAYGALQTLVLALRRRDPTRPMRGVLEIVLCIGAMPPVMRRLAVVQFFTWFALFTVWVYAVPSVAAHQFGNPAPGSAAYEAAADWVGVLFGVQDAVAIVAALCLPRIARAIGVARCHAACLAIGALSFVAMSLAPGAGLLALPWAGLGVAWASILSLPYAIVATAGPGERLGVNLGVHNIFLVLPQLFGASVLGLVIQGVFHGQLGLILPLAALSFLAAAVLSARLPSQSQPSWG